MATLAEINAAIEKHARDLAALKEQAEEIRALERSAVVEEIRAKIAKFDISAADLKLPTRRGGRTSGKAGGKLAPKYRSPTGETWGGGRGRKPRWITEALAAGRSLSEFEV